jgi:hypothetical protein
MKITDEVGQAKPEPGNATRFIWWLFTYNGLHTIVISCLTVVNDTIMSLDWPRKVTLPIGYQLLEKQKPASYKFSVGTTT